MKFPVRSNLDLGEDWHQVEFEAPDLASRCGAGQFVQVRIGEGDDPLVRRPFSVYDVGPEPGPDATTLSILYQVVGPGTRWIRSLRTGDRVDLLGPLGNRFPQFELPADGRLFLVGGGIGVAPLFFYCRELAQRSEGQKAPDCKVVLGARRSSLLVSLPRFEERGFPVEVATDDGSAGLHGNVIELLRNLTSELSATQIAGIGCGPHGMNLALRDHALEHDLDFWISLDNYMPCGFGACFGCVIPVHSAEPGGPTTYRRVCVEGPAFPAREIPRGV